MSRGLYFCSRARTKPTSKVLTQLNQSFNFIGWVSTIPVGLQTECPRLDSKRHNALAASVGARIAQQRAAVGLTQEQVAEALRIGPEAISRIERGVVMPSVARLVELAEVLDCPAEQFMRHASDLNSDLALRVRGYLESLKKSDRQFVLSLVETACNHLSGR